MQEVIHRVIEIPSPGQALLTGDVQTLCERYLRDGRTTYRDTVCEDGVPIGAFTTSPTRYWRMRTRTICPGHGGSDIVAIVQRIPLT